MCTTQKTCFFYGKPLKTNMSDFEPHAMLREQVMEESREIDQLHP